MHPVRITVLATSLVLAMAITTPATAQKCDKNHHEVEEWGSAKLRDYFCRAQGLRVTFHRLSERLAGNWIMAAPDRAIVRDIIPAKRVKNEAYTEVETLFRKFGTNNCGPGSTRLDTPRVFGRGTQHVASAERQAEVDDTSWCMTDPHPSHSSAEIYLKQTNEIIRTTDIWPGDFNHYYNCRGRHEMERAVCCTLIWQYITPSDFAEIERDTREWIGEVEDELSQSEGESASSSGIARYNLALYKSHFSLFRHLSKKGWPADFLVIAGGDTLQCGGFFGFRYFPRPLILDLLVIENISQKKVLIDDLLGSKSANENFRAVETSDVLRRKRPKALGYRKLTLEPGAAIAVPLRIVFVDGTGQETDAQYSDGSPPHGGT